jgi:NAD(P)-dependent dehydrogenase (short-subunit alcohol dehydrogenase family)
MMGRLSGKVAAITGGASGIGEATVRLFVEEGAKVAFADRDRERGERLADALQKTGAEVIFVEALMQHETEASAFIQRAETHFGHLHILVNNAGIRMYQRVTEASEESWDMMLGVNLKGYAFCAKAAIPAMQRAGGGSIVSVASIRSVRAGSTTVQYDTTKAAVAGLTRSMARDHAADGIRVNAVGPGPILTRYHEQRAADAGRDLDEFIEEFGRETMLKRPGTPREVAHCILFLASDDASFVTGTLLFVDGGKTAM